jgi:hypothetical protein
LGVLGGSHKQPSSTAVLRNKPAPAAPTSQLQMTTKSASA